MDCAVIPLRRHKSLSLVQTVDFFYPLVDDPKMMGKIALANVLSDIYAVGVTSIDKLSMLISSPTEFTYTQRDIVVPMIIDGFRESADIAGCKVGITNIAVNPWCMIGGVASSVCAEEEIIMPSGALAGDVLVLTKPIGTQLATNAFIWMQEENEKFLKLSEQFTQNKIIETFVCGLKSMSYLNKNGAHLMHKYSAHAATDITGFGLLGHANNLVKFQKNFLHFKIHKLPIIRNVMKMAKIVDQKKKLISGRAVETSGGLLICLSKTKAQAFCNEYRDITGGEQSAWIIGDVLESDDRKASIVDEPEILEV